MKRAFGLLLLCLLAKSYAGEPKENPPVPLPRAHSHNDYEHPRPLLDALDLGFCSVEADVHLVGDELLVAHDRDKVTSTRTLKALYLEPLRAKSRQNGGRIYPGGPSLILLVDIKSEAESTYAALRELLKDYQDTVTTFATDATQLRAVTVIISGNRPRKVMAGEATRWAAFDGRLEDLNGGESRHFIPLISDSWAKSFKWRGIGPLPSEEKQRLEAIVKKAHEDGRKVRFWAAPDHPAAWKVLLDAGVDLINTDHPTRLKEFLRQSRLQ